MFNKLFKKNNEIDTEINKILDKCKNEEDVIFAFCYFLYEMDNCSILSINLLFERCMVKLKSIDNMYQILSLYIIFMFDNPNDKNQEIISNINLDNFGEYKKRANNILILSKFNLDNIKIDVSDTTIENIMNSMINNNVDNFTRYIMEYDQKNKLLSCETSLLLNIKNKLKKNNNKND